MDYPVQPLPRENDMLLVDMFIRSGYTGDELISLNRCRLARQMLFLSDMATANGREIDLEWGFKLRLVT